MDRFWIFKVAASLSGEFLDLTVSVVFLTVSSDAVIGVGVGPGRDNPPREIPPRPRVIPLLIPLPRKGVEVTGADE